MAQARLRFALRGMTKAYTFLSVFICVHPWFAHNSTQVVASVTAQRGDPSRAKRGDPSAVFSGLLHSVRNDAVHQCHPAR